MMEYPDIYSDGRPNTVLDMIVDTSLVVTSLIFGIHPLSWLTVITLP